MAASPGTQVAGRGARVRLSAVQGPGSVRTGTEARFLRLRVQAPRGEERLAQPSGDEPGPMRSDAPGSLEGRAAYLGTKRGPICGFVLAAGGSRGLAMIR
jgi:hypothetical protein